MENINIAELLKDCPQGMELDSPIVDKLYFDEVTSTMIKCYTKHSCEPTSTYNSIYFYSDGSCLSDANAKCVIFPKGKTTWEGFEPPIKFKNGDIVTYKYENGLSSMILNKFVNFVEIHYHCALYDNAKEVITNNYIVGEPKYVRLATEDEKVKLLDAIKDNGYKWNEETKTLEKLIKPKFKVGDVVQDKDGYKVEITSIDIDDDYYTYQSKIVNGIGAIDFKDQDEWELVSNKFDISTLVPFETKVLVRNTEENIWKPAIFGCYVDKTFHYYVLGGTCWSYCIPYEGNEHLRGKIDDCDEYYQTWKE